MNEIKIGTQFIKRGDKTRAIWTVVDVLTTTNSKGHVVDVRYESNKPFMGQTLSDRFCANSIRMGIAEMAA